jgi:hypothetical protein
MELDTESNVTEGGKPGKRPPYTLLAWLAPVVTPLLFALGLWTGLVKQGMRLIGGVFGSQGPGEPVIMFMFGWGALTVACAGWISWRISGRWRGARRVLAYVLILPLLSIALGVAGATAGLPACMAADRP